MQSNNNSIHRDEFAQTSLAAGSKKTWQSFKNGWGANYGQCRSISRDFYSRPLHRVHEDTLSNPIPFPAYHLSPGKKMSPDDHGHRTWKMERGRQHPTGIPFYRRAKVSSRAGLAKTLSATTDRASCR